MFNRRNRAVQIKMVKTPKNDTTDETSTCNPVDIEKIEKTFKDCVTHVGIVVGAVIVTSAIATAISQIAIEKNKTTDE